MEQPKLKNEKIYRNSLFLTIKKGDEDGYVDITEDMKFETSGFIGDNIFDSIEDLFKGLYGFGICIDNLYW
jgi:hypothetical protein